MQFSAINTPHILQPLSGESRGANYRNKITFLEKLGHNIIRRATANIRPGMRGRGSEGMRGDQGWRGVGREVEGTSSR